MEIVRLTSGLTAQRLSESEQEKVWREINADADAAGVLLDLVGTNYPFYALDENRNKLEYFIVSETETARDRYDVVLKVKGKIIKIKTTVCNQDSKIDDAVRKAYQQIAETSK